MPFIMTVEDPFPDILRITLQLFAGTESRLGAEIKVFFRFQHWVDIAWARAALEEKVLDSVEGDPEEDPADKRKPSYRDALQRLKRGSPGCSGLNLFRDIFPAARCVLLICFLSTTNTPQLAAGIFYSATFKELSRLIGHASELERWHESLAADDRDSLTSPTIIRKHYEVHKGKPEA
jgi:hypothetical protein